ncbi:MAG: 2Fe-2S iron-sulfur cluster-binding protein [Nitritalea sp.]
MFGLFKRKKKEEEIAPTYLSLRVREVVRETEDTVSVHFEQPEPYLAYQPGQFLTLILSIEGKEVRRSYSLCTSPFVDPFPAIAVKRVPGGVVSNYLNDQIFPGKTIQVMKPLGNFTCNFHSKNTRNFLLLAGGSGITPMMGLIKSILVNEPLSKVHLLYASKTREEIIFRDALAKLEQESGGRLQVLHFLSREERTESGFSGRMDAAGLKAYLNAHGLATVGAQDLAFLCGPEQLMHLAEEVLEGAGWPKAQRIKESFYLEKQALPEGGEASAPALTRTVEIALEGEQYQVEVNPDKTILEAGLDQELNMPYSCQSGLCTACRGRVVQGKVTMSEDAGLSEAELADGYVLCCSAKPESDDVKIIIE